LYDPCSGKITVSKNVEFVEKRTWEWKLQEEWNSSGMFFEKEVQASKELETHTQSPSSSSNLGGCPVSSSPPPNSSPRPQKTRTPSELYKITENENNLTLFCLFFDCELVGFEEAIHDRRWKEAMDEEIKGIEKNIT